MDSGYILWGLADFAEGLACLERVPRTTARFDPLVSGRSWALDPSCKISSRCERKHGCSNFLGPDVDMEHGAHGVNLALAPPTKTADLFSES